MRYRKPVYGKLLLLSPQTLDWGYSLVIYGTNTVFQRLLGILRIKRRVLIAERGSFGDLYCVDDSVTVELGSMWMPWLICVTEAGKGDVMKCEFFGQRPSFGKVRQL